MSEPPTAARLRPLPLSIGPAVFAVSALTTEPAGFSAAAWPVAGLAAWMAIWWATEAVPLAATSLLPLIFIPLIGVPAPGEAIAEYASSSVFLILGGFLLALAMERWNLHKRIAYNIVLVVGREPRRLVLGMLIACAALSMWVSNTSTALMMLPVALSIALIVTRDGEPANIDERNFVACLLLAVAYGATIGGLGSLIGTPTNALVQGYMKSQFDFDLSFVDWLKFGVPTVLLLVPLAWLAMVRFALPFRLPAGTDAHGAVRDALAALGPMRREEYCIAVVFGTAAGAWVFRPWLNEFGPLEKLSDMGIAVAAGLSMFLIPAKPPAGGALLQAHDLARVPWDVLLLFGGGLALAAAIQSSTLGDTLGGYMQVFGVLPLILLTTVIVLILVFWTELNSNVATAATFMPVLAALAAGTDHSVLEILAPAAMASSAGFMLPVGTPPSAIVFATRKVALKQMLRAGLLIDLIAVVVIVLVGYFTVPLIVHR
ncbi:MAG TPA: DASS family sodium-coupled anion symporter [Steroidobacteraceae bacterium]|nr:DASS family sodium-coupled anion symporter [Steroidobacteraceae bacterium]HRX89398.1 DASS family sodium-coupled anion symporter [Steroidobacteraceae bacterium]